MQKGILAVASIVLATEAQAIVLINPSSVASSSQTQAEGVIQSSDVSYDIERTEVEIERRILGAQIAHGMSQGFDIVGQFGLIADTEVETIDKDGDGFLFGGGARFGITQSGRLRLKGHALYNYGIEKIRDDSTKYEIEGHELHTGITAAFQASPMIVPYAGLDIVLFDDGEIKTSTRFSTTQTDLELDNMFALKLGVNIQIDAVTLRPEATIIGEQALTFGVGSSF